MTDDPEYDDRHDHIAAINLPNGEQTVMETIESVHYPNKTVNTLRRRSKDGPFVEGPERREGTSDQIDRNRRCDLATEKRALDQREPSRRVPACRTCLRNEVDRIRGIAIQLISDVAARLI